MQWSQGAMSSFAFQGNQTTPLSTTEQQLKTDSEVQKHPQVLSITGLMERSGEAIWETSCSLPNLTLSSSAMRTFLKHVMP